MRTHICYGCSSTWVFRSGQLSGSICGAGDRPTRWRLAIVSVFLRRQPMFSLAVLTTCCQRFTEPPTTNCPNYRRYCLYKFYNRAGQLFTVIITFQSIGFSGFTFDLPHCNQSGQKEDEIISNKLQDTLRFIFIWHLPGSSDMKLAAT